MAIATAASARDTGLLDALGGRRPGKEGPSHRRAARDRGVARGGRAEGRIIANDVRAKVEAALDEARTRLRLELAARLTAEAVDVTTPGRPFKRGNLHPISETIGEIARVFEQFGFVVYESPEVEDGVRNFQMLNIPPRPPARDVCGTRSTSTSRIPPADAYVARPDRGHAGRAAADASAGRCFRYENVAADRNTEVLPGRGTHGGRGHLHGRPPEGCSVSSPMRCSVPGSGPVSGPATTVHRAIGRLRRRVPRLRQRGLPGLQARAG